MELGTDLALHLGKRKKDDPLLSRTWLGNFMGRWPELRVIKPRGLAVIRAKCASPVKIAAYYEERKRILQKYDLEDKPEAIYNIDEKGLPTEQIPLLERTVEDSQSLHLKIRQQQLLEQGVRLDIRYHRFTFLLIKEKLIT